LARPAGQQPVEGGVEPLLDGHLQPVPGTAAGRVGRRAEGGPAEEVGRPLRGERLALPGLPGFLRGEPGPRGGSGRFHGLSSGGQKPLSAASNRKPSSPASPESRLSEAWLSTRSVSPSATTSVTSGKSGSVTAW